MAELHFCVVARLPQYLLAVPVVDGTVEADAGLARRALHRVPVALVAAVGLSGSGIVLPSWLVSQMTLSPKVIEEIGCRSAPIAHHCAGDALRGMLKVLLTSTTKEVSMSEKGKTGKSRGVPTYDHQPVFSRKPPEVPTPQPPKSPPADKK